MLINIDFNKLLQLFVYEPKDPLLFSSSLFLFLFFGLLVLYKVFSKFTNIRISILILFSLFFYYKASGMFLILLLASSFINYFAAKLIHSSGEGIKRRLMFVAVVLLNLGALVYFKYTNFFIQIVNDLSSGKIEPLNILMPIGISYFTFKALSYVIDIYMELYEPAENVSDFVLYMVFFPNILLGPIDRPDAFIPQIRKDYELTNVQIGQALLLIGSGVVKKIVIADYIYSNFIVRVFDSPTRFTGIENLIAVYGNALYIYCDFSGYVDMALGIALLLGFKIMDNFNAPYKATSVADFWRRWHISLSTWLLDYLFRPLQMKFRSLKIFGNGLALFITFAICGLWHGANWPFIFWGALHGAYMVISLFTKNIRTSFYKKIGIENSIGLKIFQGVITFHLVLFGWIFFSAGTFQNASDIIKQIIYFFHGEVFTQFIDGYKTVFGLMIFGYVMHFFPVKWRDKSSELLGKVPAIGQAVILALIIWIAIQAKSADIQPFIYLQF